MPKINFTLKNKKEVELFLYKVLPLYYGAIGTPELLPDLAITVSTTLTLVFFEWSGISKTFNYQFCVLDFRVKSDKSVVVIGNKVK